MVNKKTENKSFVNDILKNLSKFILKILNDFLLKF